MADLNSDPMPATAEESAWRRWLKPRALQAKANLRVWLPGLLSPERVACRVSYWGRESRERGVWYIALPSRCALCDARSGLSRVDFEWEVRNFDAPLTVLGATIGLAILILPLALYLGSLIVWGVEFLLLAACPALLWLRSWEETIELSLGACPAHRDALTRPRAVFEDEQLHLFLPSSELAMFAREELQAQRMRWGNQRGPAPRHDTTASDRPREAAEKQPSDAASPAKGQSPWSIPRAPSPDLPPIKLSDD